MNRIRIMLEKILYSMDKKKIIFILAGVVVLVVLILLIIYFFTGNKFELNKTEIILDLVENKSEVLYTTLNNSKNSSVTWTSSNENIVSIDKDGKITARSIGQVVITATYKGTKKTCNVIVNDLPRTLTMDREVYLDLENNREYQLDVNIYIDIVTYESKYKSSDESVVKVSADGTLTAVGVGTATVTAMYEELTADCKVTVTKGTIITTQVPNYSYEEDALDKIFESDYEFDNTITTTQPVTRISILETMIYLSATNSRTLTVYVYPKSIEDPIITWTSSNEEVATVDENGKVTGVSKGTAIITATASNGKKTSCVVSVLNQLPESIEFKENYLSIDMAKSTTKKLEIVYKPSNSAHTAIKWDVSDESIISISSTGFVTPLKVGYTDVTASTSTGLTASTRVYVNKSSTDSRGWHIEYNGGAGIKRDVYYYMQGNYYDKPWCNAPGKTIASSGCGPTALAISISTLLDVKITPIETTAKVFSYGENRYCGSGISGTSLSAIKPVAESYGLYVLDIRKNSCSINKLKMALQRGDVAIVSIMSPGAFTLGGHYITLTGYENGKIQVYDPNKGWSKANAPYNYSVRNAWWDESIVISQNRGRFWFISTSPLTEIDAMC